MTKEELLSSIYALIAESGFSVEEIQEVLDAAV